MWGRLRKLDLLCLLVVLTITVFCGTLFGFRLAREYRRIQFENELMLKKSQDLTLAESMLVQVRRILKRTRDELDLLNERIPETAEIGDLLKTVDAHSRQRSIKITAIEHLSTEKLKRYTRIPLQLKLEGGFTDIYRVVGDFETMNRIFITDRLVISREASEPTCQVELKASVFRR